jgi:hypothetical protein
MRLPEASKTSRKIFGSPDTNTTPQDTSLKKPLKTYTFPYNGKHLELKNKTQSKLILSLYVLIGGPFVVKKLLALSAKTNFFIFLFDVHSSSFFMRRA